MRTIAFAALAAVASADKSSFPGFDSFHAHCEITLTADKACGDVYNAIADVIANDKDTASPPGHYKTKEQKENDYVWSTRLTANGKYTDDQIFELSDKDGKCDIHARSRSQSFSVYDNNVNFCNLFNVIKQAESKISGGSGYTVGNCPHGQSDFNACGRY